MNFTLKAGDGLIIVSCDNCKIRAGDVVTYKHPTDTYDVVHRVISVSSNGILTHGDNNDKTDPYILKPEKVDGKIVAVLRGGGKIKISGGIRGLIRFYFLRIFFNFKNIFRPITSSFAEIFNFNYLFRLVFKPKLVTFNRPSGNEIQLLTGNFWIARKKPGEKDWEIKFPFRFFINKNKLP